MTEHFSIAVERVLPEPLTGSLANASRRAGLRRAAFLTLLAGVLLVTAPAVPQVFAQDHGSEGHSSSGHGSGHSGHSGHKGKGGGHGGGHSSEDGGARGGGGRGHAGQPAGRGGGRAARNDVLSGGRPVWAGGGIPEVELGRLNVARAPSHVLDRAWINAQEDFDPQMAAFYSLGVDQAALLLETDQDNVARFHSPLQNLALYNEAMVYGRVEVLPSSHISGRDLASIFLGSAADKNIPITEDTVTAVNRILGLIELSPDERAALATSAEQVRSALLAGHGEESGDHGH